MPSAARLSDEKTFTNIPDGATDDQAQALIAQAEARLANHYGEQAKAQDAPVYTPGHIYSATRTYPNWADWASDGVGRSPRSAATG